MKVFYTGDNFGDKISKTIYEFFCGPCEEATTGDKEKLVMVGSFLDIIEEGDILFGTGSNKEYFTLLKKPVYPLMLRGPLTKSQIPDCPNVLEGDPCYLLPDIFPPQEKRKKEGIIPHYIDWDKFEGQDIIRVDLPVEDYIAKVTECELIESSSLHGIVVAHAYGIPAIWREYSDRIAGGSFKFQDYFLGAHLGLRKPNEIIEPPDDRLRKNMRTFMKRILLSI